jgi:peptidoglycan hydrolase CwlO-like protein
MAKLSLQTVFAVLLLCACGAILMSVDRMLGHSATSPEQPRLERQLQQLSRDRTRMEQRLDKLLGAVEQLQVQLASKAPTATAAAAKVTMDGAAEDDTEPPRQATTSAPETTSAPQCPDRRPYHTVLTATGSNYQQWQAARPPHAQLPCEI